MTCEPTVPLIVPWCATSSRYFTTLVIHSFGDFGLHIPAIALLATVLAAHLCGLEQEDRGLAQGSAAAEPRSGGDEYRLRIGGLAPFLGAATAVALGLVLCGAGWRAHRVDRLRVAASLGGTGVKPGGPT